MGILDSILITNPVIYAGVKLYERYSQVDAVELIEQKALDLTTSFVTDNLIAPFSIIVSNIWEWILVNILAPIIIFAYLILFFIAQYYLIKIYIWIIKNIYTKILGLISYINTNKKVQEILDRFRDLFTI